MGGGLATLGGLGMRYAVVSTDGKSVAIENAAAGWACLVSIYVYVFGFAWSWGPVCWLYPTEAVPTSQRGKGVALTTGANFLLNFLVAQFTPVLKSKMHFAMFAMFAGM